VKQIFASVSKQNTIPAPRILLRTTQVSSSYHQSVYVFSSLFVCLFVCLMMFNATFNNISVISWRSVLLVEETGGPGEKHRPVGSDEQTLSYNVVHLALIMIRTHNISSDRH
jgi:hypothetical protein